jgi:predicted ribosomally synthesized peptide with nif11-like leader
MRARTQEETTDTNTNRRRNNMSGAAAIAFLDKVENDKDFGEKIKAFSGNPTKAQAAVKEAGFNVTQEEIKAAFLARYGSELTPEQLEKIAGGLTDDQWITIGVGAGSAVIAAAAAFAAAAI